MPPDTVAHYYDRNTRRFLLMGRSGVHSIHRELWGPGVGSAREAADYVNRIIDHEIAGHELRPSPVILDFGCGVGGTLFHLARRMQGAQLHGLTVSARQVEIADRLAAKEGLAHRCSFTLGDFHTTDLRLSADAIVAVESFVHSADPSAFLANADRHLLPGGRLIIVDDFLASERESMDARQRRRVEQFQAGWRVPGVCMAERLVSVAAEHGLEMEKTVDLTSLTRPGSRLRDRLTAALSPLLVGLGLSGNPFCGNLIGGHALQVGLREGLFRYRLLTFRKPV